MAPKQSRLLLSFSVVLKQETSKSGKRDCPFSSFLYNDPWVLGLYFCTSVQLSETRNLFRSPNQSQRTGPLIFIPTNGFTKQWYIFYILIVYLPLPVVGNIFRGRLAK